MLQQHPAPLRIKAIQLIRPTGNCPHLSDAIPQLSPASRYSGQMLFPGHSTAAPAPGPLHLPPLCLETLLLRGFARLTLTPSGLSSNAVSRERPSPTALTKTCTQPPTISSISSPCFLLLSIYHYLTDTWGLGYCLHPAPHDNINFKQARTLLYSLLQPCAQIGAWHLPVPV